MDQLSPPGGYDDDVALLLYRHPGPLELDFAAERASSPRSAPRCAAGSAAADVDPTNAYRRAGRRRRSLRQRHRARPPRQPRRRIRLRAAATADGLHLTVTDSGRWKTPQPGVDTHRGRGLVLMRALMDAVTVTPGTTGTTIDMQARIR